MIHVIATDIDGTLIDHTRALPPENRVALQHAVERGVRVALVTVRKRDSTELIARQLGVGCTLVCQAGATMYDEHGTLLRAVSIPMDIARPLAELADTHNLPMVTTIDEVNYHTSGHGHLQFAAPGVDVARHVDALHTAPTRFIVRGERGIALLSDAFKDAPLRFVRHYALDGTLVDAAITHIDATKESALQLLCNTWNVAPTQVMALGDSEADIGMLRLAGIGVAMGDAHPPVRAAADWVAPPASEGGLAAAVRQFVFEESNTH